GKLWNQNKYKTFETSFITQYSNLEDVVDLIKEEIKGPGLHHGYRIMLAKCRDREIDPEGVEIRTPKRLVRRAYFAKGPNCIWHIDRYDN
ncbi:hypothetical protein KUTeg_005415, partial [Tegillarca granosa]